MYKLAESYILYDQCFINFNENSVKETDFIAMKKFKLDASDTEISVNAMDELLENRI